MQDMCSIVAQSCNLEFKWTLRQRTGMVEDCGTVCQPGQGHRVSHEHQRDKKKEKRRQTGLSAEKRLQIFAAALIDFRESRASPA